MILFQPLCRQDRADMAIHRINPIKCRKPYDDRFEFRSYTPPAPIHTPSFPKPIEDNYPYDIRNDQANFRPIESSSDYILKMLYGLRNDREKDKFSY